jgi:hypothetical protein
MSMGTTRMYYLLKTNNINGIVMSKEKPDVHRVITGHKDS